MKKTLVVLFICLFPIYLSANKQYSITFASFKNMENAKSERERLLKILEGKISANQLQIKDIGSYKVLRLNNVQTRALKNELVLISQQYYPDLIVRRIRTKQTPMLKKEKLKTQSIEVKDNSEFERGVRLYNQKRYQEAYNLFSQLETEGFKNEKFYFYMGRTAFELGMYSEAIANYDLLLEINPTHSRTRLEKARAHFLLKEYAKAKKEFKAALTMPLPVEVRKNVESFLAKIDQAEKKNYFNGMIYFGYGDDTNVFNNTFLGTTEYGSLILQNNTQEKNGVFHREIFALEHLYRFSDYENIAWNSNFMIYSNRYRDFDDQDILLLSFSSGPQYMTQTYKVITPLTYDRIFYGNKEYLRILGIAPSIEYILNSVSALKAAFRFNDKSFAQNTDRDKDASYMELKVGYNRLVLRDNILSLKGVFANERKKSGSRLDIDHNRLEASVSYMLPINDTIKSNAVLGYYKNFYTDTDAVLDRRIDSNTYINLGLTKQFSEKIAAGVSFNYSKNESNINSYSYKKSIYMANIMMAF